jgi:hypothetical protein
MTSHFLAILVRPANRDIPRANDGSLPDCRLLAEWPAEAWKPADYWLSALPADAPIEELVQLVILTCRCTRPPKGPGHGEDLAVIAASTSDATSTASASE